MFSCVLVSCHVYQVSNRICLVTDMDLYVFCVLIYTDRVAFPTSSMHCIPKYKPASLLLLTDIHRDIIRENFELESRAVLNLLQLELWCFHGIYVVSQPALCKKTTVVVILRPCFLV